MPTLAPLADIHFAGNLLEAALWITVGLIFVGYAVRSSAAAVPRCWLAAIAFVAFGLSDLIETRTGAWWRPWWLLVWKTVCVAVILALAMDHYRRLRDRHQR